MKPQRGSNGNWKTIEMLQPTVMPKKNESNKDNTRKDADI